MEWRQIVGKTGRVKTVDQTLNQPTKILSQVQGLMRRKGNGVNLELKAHGSRMARLPNPQ